MRNLPALTRKAIYAQRDQPGLRWGQAIVNHFGLEGRVADRLFYADDSQTQQIVDRMINDLQLGDQ